MSEDMFSITDNQLEETVNRLLDDEDEVQSNYHWLLNDGNDDILLEANDVEEDLNTSIKTTYTAVHNIKFKKANIFRLYKID